MVDVARRRAAALELEGVSFATEDAVALSLAGSSVDGVLCRWGLMLVPEMDSAAAEIARVLRPDGRAAVAVWADPAANDWMTAAGRSALELGLMERPDPDAPGPFRLSPEGRLAELLTRAGLDVHTVEDVPLTWRARSLDAWWAILSDTSQMLARLVARLSESDVVAVRAGAKARLARYVAADGSLAVPGLARVALAARPGGSAR